MFVNPNRDIMSSMTAPTILSADRKKLLRELRKVNRQLEWPAIYSSRELMREVKRERREIITKLRDLPRAS